MLVKLTQRCDRSRSVSVNSQHSAVNLSRCAFSKQSHFPVYSPLTSASHDSWLQSGVGHRQPQKLTVQQSVRRPRGSVLYPVPCLPLSDLVSLAHSVSYVKHNGLYVIRSLLLLRSLPSLNKRIVYYAMSVVGPMEFWFELGSGQS